MQRLCLILFVMLTLAGCQRSDERGQVAATAVPPTPTLPIGVSLVTKAPPTLAVVQTTPTPLPTATSTPTPTPIVYTIESGDTLLAIALQRNVTVADIEALNPNIRAELLQIGQQVVLPPPATAVAQAAAGTPVPLQVDVVSLETVRTPVGSVWVLGEVANRGQAPAANVQVTVSLPVQGGEHSVTTWTAGALVPAGGRAPFAALVTELPELTGAPSVVVSGGESVPDLGTQYLEVVAADTAVSISDEQARVDGVVVNQGEAEATAVTIIATFYGAAGQVVGYARQTLPGTLAVGAERLFALDAAPPGGAVSDVEILVLAQRVPAPDNN